MCRLKCAFVVVALVAYGGNALSAAPQTETPPDSIVQELAKDLSRLSGEVAALRTPERLQNRSRRAELADVAIFEKAVAWQLRHNEFYKPAYVDQARQAIKTGRARAAELSVGSPSWPNQQGTTIRGYFSRVDQSVQPYALTLPPGVNPLDSRRWPLYVVLHGRANQMNEVNFISRFEGKKSEQFSTWIQLDVYGRGSNAYRWAGETDVFEAIQDVKQRFRIDESRVTLHGFSMGGAGAWHLGLHYPHLWSSVGPGAGFVDFYKYQNQTARLPHWQDQTLGIYDAVDYALNAANVPVCTYGGELDPQLAASTTMAELAAAQDVSIQVLTGPGMGHKFDAESLKQFMAFHAEKSAAGRPSSYDRKHIRFTTRTLRYSQCDWLTIEEVENVYQPSTIEALVNADGDVEITTENITAFRISRDIATDAVIDGILLPCRTAADGLLPDVYFQKIPGGWRDLGYDESRAFADNPELKKRPGLQGPIDDAFMEAFLCVRGTGQPVLPSVHDWAMGELKRFSTDFDLWMRGEVRIMDDHQITDELTADHNLILFGDPQSNAVIAQVLEKLPVAWDAQTIRIGDQSWDATSHVLSLIYPNPLNPRRYVVINSGHTLSDADFQASNAWLFPRLGDIAVRRLPEAESVPRKSATGPVATSPDIVWAANFGAGWTLNP